MSASEKKVRILRAMIREELEICPALAARARRITNPMKLAPAQEQS